MGVMQLKKKIEDKERKDFESRKDLLMADLKKAVKKYQIDLVPVIDVQELGIRPLIATVDVKGKEEEAKLET